jgi:hypothetical protein
LLLLGKRFSVKPEEITELENKYKEFTDALISNESLFSDMMNYFLPFENKHSKALKNIDDYFNRMFCVESLLDMNSDVNMHNICLINRNHLYNQLKNYNIIFNVVSKRNMNEVSPEFEALVKQLK